MLLKRKFRLPPIQTAAIRPWNRWRPYWQAAQTKALPLLSVLLLVMVIIVPIALFSWFFFFTDMFQVQAITVIDAKSELSAQIKELISSRLAQSPLGQNIFFAQTDSLETEAVSKFPQIRTIHVVRKLPGTIKAIVQEKQPALLLLSNGQYYFVDQEGVTYQEAHIADLPGIVLPTVKNDDQSSKVTLGVAAVAPSFVSFVQNIEEALPKEVSAKPAEIHIPSLAAREIHVKLDNNWLILFDATRPAASQMTVLQKLLSTTISATEASQLEYIDLRIPNRVYYKTKQ